MKKQYTVEALAGGGETFDDLEEARQYADELLGENDSSTISITDEAGVRHYTNPQLELIRSLPPAETPDPPLPRLSINLQIHISPQASEAQIETIMNSMEKHLLRS